MLFISPASRHLQHFSVSYARRAIMTDADIDTRVGEVFSKYEKFANMKYDGEEITLLEHSLQSAQMAEESNAPAEVVLGAFFHDMGHVLEVEDSFLPENERKIIVGKHTKTGHAYLTKLGFPPSITSGALHHVNAKRYLVHKDEAYYNGLSETSKRTLMEQGGPMTPADAEQFESLDGYQGIVQVRKWDDKAKIVDKTTQPVEHYKRMCLEFLKGQQA